MLYLKWNDDKIQLLVRMENATGKILLNVQIIKNTPMSRKGKNNAGNGTKSTSIFETNRRGQFFTLYIFDTCKDRGRCRHPIGENAVKEGLSNFVRLNFLVDSFISDK